MATRTTRTEKLDLRLSPEAKQTLAAAAEVEHRSVSDFVLLSALARAHETLLDRTVFPVSPEVYAKFVALLDAPPQPNERLRRSLQTPAPWERA